MDGWTDGRTKGWNGWTGYWMRGCMWVGGGVFCCFCHGFFFFFWNSSWSSHFFAQERKKYGSVLKLYIQSKMTYLFADKRHTLPDLSLDLQGDSHQGTQIEIWRMKWNVIWLSFLSLSLSTPPVSPSLSPFLPPSLSPSFLFLNIYLPTYLPRYHLGFFPTHSIMSWAIRYLYRIIHLFPNRAIDRLSERSFHHLIQTHSSNIGLIHRHSLESRLSDSRFSILGSRFFDQNHIMSFHFMWCISCIYLFYYGQVVRLSDFHFVFFF